jgi:DHA2 family multidrug resistance protein
MDPATASNQALAVIDRIVRRESYVMAYNDGFWIIGLVLIGCIAAIWLADKVKSPGGASGAH